MLQSKIVLVTPMKNEAGNIPDLFSAIASQSSDIYAWIIVENGSDDETPLLLAQTHRPANVENLIILPFKLPNETYALGSKYATVVSRGFAHYMELVDRGVLSKADYIGILDADCFPEPNYYSELIRRMDADSVDVSSGIGVFTNGEPDGEASDWVRGNCRLWKMAVFEDAGYIVGPSADALSIGKARLKGYCCRPYLDLVYRCREMGSRTKYRYYGYSAYYRGVPLGYTLLRTLKLLALGKYRYAGGYLRGYLESMAQRVPRLNDEELFRYFNAGIIARIRTKLGREP